MARRRGGRDQRVSEQESPAEKWVDSGLFVGRTQALDRLHELVEGGARLVTVLGPEGIGKSRVAYRYAAVHEPRYAREGGGAFLCDRSDAMTVDEVLRRLAGVLHGYCKQEVELSSSRGVGNKNSYSIFFFLKSVTLVPPFHYPHK